MSGYNARWEAAQVLLVQISLELARSRLPQLEQNRLAFLDGMTFSLRQHHEAEALWEVLFDPQTVESARAISDRCAMLARLIRALPPERPTVRS